MDEIINMITKITIVGKGRVASHLLPWLSQSGYEVIQIDSHTLTGIDPETDLCLVAVSDSAIEEVAKKADKKITKSDAIIAHISGTSSISLINTLQRPSGVVYPMQTFTKGRSLKYREIPIFVEGSNPDISEKLMQFAATISDSVQIVDSYTRAKIHLGAVFACNFLNHLLGMAFKSISGTGVNPEIYEPLVYETISKAFSLGTEKSQTGPACRNDLTTINKHLEMLQTEPDMALIYKQLSDSIYNQTLILNNRE